MPARDGVPAPRKDPAQHATGPPSGHPGLEPLALAISADSDEVGRRFRSKPAARQRHRVGAAERQERIAYPFSPRLETPERQAAFQVGGILPGPAPNGQRRTQQLGAALKNPVEKADLKAARLRVLALGAPLAAR